LTDASNVLKVYAEVFWFDFCGFVSKWQGAWWYGAFIKWNVLWLVLRWLRWGMLLGLVVL
jgi:hypothetical protein